jgi:SulP family sulfate permease
MTEPSPITAATLIRNLVVGLAVSFVALSLGAAFGILSGRGAFAGMISAGIIPIVTALVGGTRVRCSGPTAPMSVVTATVVAMAYDSLDAGMAGIEADRFVNLVLIVTAGLLIVMAALRAGGYISLIPNVVVSGFMNGIALIIWVSQGSRLFEFGDTTGFDGPMTTNVAVAGCTLVLIFAWPAAIRAWAPRWERWLPPATLAALVLVTVSVQSLGLQIGTIDVGAGITSLGQLRDLAAAQWPRDWSPPVLWLALPFAVELALLCYLDTLLTSLVVDRMSGERTQANRELLAQGAANGAAALVGGIPGAQATIRSVLVLKEGGTLRVVGVFIGVFVLVEMILFQDLIGTIPQAVFAGILLKVGYDVLDVEPLRAYATRLAGRARAAEAVFVTHLEMALIAGTTAVTLLWDLNAAVATCTALFYLINKVLRPHDPIPDLKPDGRLSEED